VGKQHLCSCTAEWRTVRNGFGYRAGEHEGYGEQRTI